MSITTASGQTIVDFRISSVHGVPAIGAYLLKISLAYEMPPHEDEIAFFHNTIDAAAKWAHKLGIGTLQLEIGKWHPGQKGLKL